MTDQKINETVEKYNEAKVGYKNPPKDTRFKKGQSGNPAGRKKKPIPKSLHESIMQELADSITIMNMARLLKCQSMSFLEKPSLTMLSKMKKAIPERLLLNKCLKQMFWNIKK